MDATGKTEDQLDLIWGAKDIGKAIGLSERQAFNLLANDLLPPVKQIGARYVVSRRKLVAFFEAEG